MGNSPVHSEVDNSPAHIDIDPIDDLEWSYYWTAWVGGVHVNGGLGTSVEDCMHEAKRAIFYYRHWGSKTGWDHNLDWKR